MTTIQTTTSLASKRPTHVPTTVEIERYMVLVRQVVARCVRRLPASIGRDELMSAGTEGLFDALRKGGAEQGASFEAYARLRIRGAIMDELRSRDWLSRKDRATATSDAGASPVMVNIDEHAGAVEDCSDWSASPFDQLASGRDTATLATAVQALPARERHVVESYYLRDEALTDVAANLGVTVSRASQLRARAIATLRVVLETATATGPMTSHRRAA